MQPHERLGGSLVQIAGTDHLTSRQVARRLGVKVQTVYAYVSRGVLHPRRLPGRPESYFPLAEVEALTSSPGGTRRRAPGLSDDVRTGLTLIEHDRLSYRGQDACILATGSRFADVVSMLWQHPAVFVARGEDVAASRLLLAALPQNASPVDRFRVVTSVVAGGTPTRQDLDPRSVTAAAARLMAASALTVPSRWPDRPAPHPSPSVGPGPGPDGGPQYPRDPAADPSLFGDLADSATAGNPTGLDLPEGLPATLASRLGVTDCGWVEQACILLVDHDMAGSTTAARVAASVRADPFAVLTAAAAAFDSPLHGTAGRRAYRLVTALAEDSADTLAQCLQQDSVPGFGHLVYTEQDPRAELLMATLTRLVDHPLLASAELLADRLWQRRGWPRTVDFALAVGAHLLGGGPLLPETLFLHARMAGWTAHLLEEYAEPPMRFRLQGVYTGPRP